MIVQGTSSPREKLVHPGSSETDLTGLSPWTWYNVEVVAYNDQGPGPASVTARARTLAEGMIR